MGADSVKFAAKTCHLACLLRPIWHLGNHRAMQGGLGAHGRRPWGSRLGFLMILKDFRTAIWTFLANFGTTTVFFGMCVCRPRFLKILGSESGCLGLQNQVSGVEGIAKSKFPHMSGLCRFWCYFYMVFDGFGTNFYDFWWPGGRLETS